MTDKTEKATPYKLQKAKEKGQVSKSIELTNSVFLIAMVIVGLALWPPLLKHLKALMSQLLSLSPNSSLSADKAVKLQYFLLSTLATWWLPFALAVVLSLVLTTIAQTGFVWSLHPLSPDTKRLNLVQGFKRLFSTKLLFEAAKSSLKLSLIFALVILSLRQERITLLKLMTVSPIEHPGLIMRLLSKLIIQLAALLLVLASIDKLYNSWKFKKDNRMSKQELKDEYRQREGDPKIKAKLRQIQQQLRQKTASLELVKKADVVVTNPHHLAIALNYERATMPAPKVVCKAKGELAIQVRILAKRHKVPLIENKLFARALFASVELNQFIGQEHFPVAALIFGEIYRQRELASC